MGLLQCCVANPSCAALRLIRFAAWDNHESCSIALYWIALFTRRLPEVL